MRLILDTSFLVDVQRGRESATRLAEALAEQEHEILVPTLVAVEFLGGSRDPRADLETLEAAGEIVEFGASDADASITIARALHARGRFPGWVDVMIAGTATARSARVVTRNGAHFAEGLRLAYD